MILKSVIKVILSIAITIFTLLTFYNVSKLKIDFIESTMVRFFDDLLGDYGYVYLIVLGINILLIFDIIFRKYNTKTKTEYSMSILAIPFSNIVYLWKREFLK